MGLCDLLKQNQGNTQITEILSKNIGLWEMSTWVTIQNQAKKIRPRRYKTEEERHIGRQDRERYTIQITHYGDQKRPKERENRRKVIRLNDMFTTIILKLR